MTAWIILITENIFLLGLLIIWINRECQRCQQVKCLERMFNRICRECKDKKNKTSRKKKETQL